MGDVYKHSYLNIAAASAKNDEEGCFFLRDMVAGLAPCKVDINSELHYPPLGDDPGFFFSLKKPFWISQPDAWSHYVENARIQERGWVFQECLLAPRTVYFSYTHVAWECRASTLHDLDPFVVETPPKFHHARVSFVDL